MFPRAGVPFLLVAALNVFLGLFSRSSPWGL